MTRKQEGFAIFFSFMIFLVVGFGSLVAAVREDKKNSMECQSKGGTYVYRHCLDVKEIK